MAYDRYDTGRERDWRAQDQRRSRDDQHSRNEERGFFERAGDEIASWFGGDDAYDRGRSDHERMSRERGWSDRDRDHDRNRYAYGGWGGDSERERSFSREGRGPERGSWDQRGGGRFRDSSAGGYRPMTGDYGRAQGSGDEQRRTGFASTSRTSDQHYHQWRQRQLDELDRDYDQYCRERQDRFEKDFGSWRQGRQQKRQQLGTIREQMEVVGSDGQPIGHVDKIRGDTIILAKSDSDDNRHHAIDCSMIDKVEGEQLRLTVPAEEAKSRWSETGDRGIFGIGSSDERDEGDLSLERSFSGTYR